MDVCEGPRSKEDHGGGFRVLGHKYLLPEPHGTET